MNLIVNRQLDRTQKQVIYELTLKKRQSKKSTMSEKQVLARQQLAKELMQERKFPLIENHFNNNNIITSNYNYSSCNNSSIIETSDNSSISASGFTFNTDDHHNHHNLINDDQQNPSEQISGTINTAVECSSSLDNKSIYNSNSNNGCCTTNHNHIIRHQNQTTTTTSCCSSCSFSRSDSSYSGSSQDSGAQMMIAEREDLSQEERNEILGRKKEANIKFNKIRLEHLNSELDKRLQQYEYLVAQEKALLGTYNMMLFTNEGVNNFHLHDALTNPNNRRQHQKQLQQNKYNAHKNFNGFINSNANIAASNLNLTTTSTSSKLDKVPELKKTVSTSSSRPQLNSSASTVSNLNNIHVLPSALAGPRRSASSVALITITQR